MQRQLRLSLSLLLLAACSSVLLPGATVRAGKSGSSALENTAVVDSQEPRQRASELIQQEPRRRASELIESPSSTEAEGETPESKKTPTDDVVSTKLEIVYTPYRRVPRYFGMIGLSSAQKEEMYSVRGRYQGQIKALEQQIEALKQQEMAACEAMLTETQASLLKNLRERRGKAGANPVPPVPVDTDQPSSDR